MHLRVVEIFCDVAQRRSFSKGALAHHVSQSSASQAVNLLEKRLGTRLIDRSKRPLELTPAGKVYYEGCRELLDRFRSIEDRVQRLHDRVTGSVRVAAIYSVGLMQMEQTVQRFEELYPDTYLRLEYLHPDAVYAQVLSDEADLGLVSFPRHGGDFLTIDWQEQSMVLVVPPAHRLAGEREITISELDGEEYVGFTRDLTIRREVDRWLKKGHVTVNVVHEFDNIETIKRAIEIGSGVALLPEPTIWRETAAGSLVAVRLGDQKLIRPLGIVHRRHKQLTTAVQKFVDLLRGIPPAESVTSDNGRSLNGRSAVAAHPTAAGGTRVSTAMVGTRRQKKRKRA